MFEINICILYLVYTVFQGYLPLVFGKRNRVSKSVILYCKNADLFRHYETMRKAVVFVISFTRAFVSFPRHTVSHFNNLPNNHLVT